MFAAKSNTAATDGRVTGAINSLIDSPELSKYPDAKLELREVSGTTAGLWNAPESVQADSAHFWLSSFGQSGTLSRTAARRKVQTRIEKSRMRQVPRPRNSISPHGSALRVGSKAEEYFKANEMLKSAVWRVSNITT